jgi:hypothetical protein
LQTPWDNGEEGSNPAGAAFAHKKGNRFTLLIGGKRYAAFPPKAKTAGRARQVSRRLGAQGVHARRL